MALYIIMMGVQGAGKGMQAGIIQQDYGIPQVSTGDLFRAMFSREDELAQRVKAILAAGDLVPDDITCQMVEERLAQPDAAGGAILDGFPRNDFQAEWLKDHLASKGERVTAVLLLELDLYIAFKRAFGRVTDKETGKSFNVFYHSDGITSWDTEKHPEEAFPPRLDVKLANGNPVKRRADDADAVAVLNRIDTYMDNTMPLIEYYDAQGLVVKI
ncbi:MAG: nucleoside monophosphate kinase, partial [Chloroflexota bacterium]